MPIRPPRSRWASLVLRLLGSSPGWHAFESSFFAANHFTSLTASFLELSDLTLRHVVLDRGATGVAAVGPTVRVAVGFRRAKLVPNSISVHYRGKNPGAPLPCSSDPSLGSIPIRLHPPDTISCWARPRPSRKASQLSRRPSSTD